jgi:hypothetical protein
MGVRWVLIALLAFAVIAGAFAAGALVFGGDDEERRVTKVELRCVSGGEDCLSMSKDARRQICRQGSVDAVEVTYVFATSDTLGPRSTSPYGGRGTGPRNAFTKSTTTYDC